MRRDPVLLVQVQLRGSTRNVERVVISSQVKPWHFVGAITVIECMATFITTHWHQPCITRCIVSADLHTAAGPLCHTPALCSACRYDSHSSLYCWRGLTLNVPLFMASVRSPVAITNAGRRTSATASLHQASNASTRCHAQERHPLSGAAPYRAQRTTSWHTCGSRRLRCKSLTCTNQNMRRSVSSGATAGAVLAARIPATVERHVMEHVVSHALAHCRNVVRTDKRRGRRLRVLLYDVR